MNSVLHHKPTQAATYSVDQLKTKTLVVPLVQLVPCLLHTSFQYTSTWHLYLAVHKQFQQYLQRVDCKPFSLTRTFDQEIHDLDCLRATRGRNQHHHHLNQPKQDSPRAGTSTSEKGGRRLRHRLCGAFGCLDWMTRT
jgi:hypothetical protein